MGLKDVKVRITESAKRATVTVKEKAPIYMKVGSDISKGIKEMAEVILNEESYIMFSIIDNRIVEDNIYHFTSEETAKKVFRALCRVHGVYNQRKDNVNIICLSLIDNEWGILWNSQDGESFASSEE